MGFFFSIPEFWVGLFWGPAALAAPPESCLALSPIHNTNFELVTGQDRLSPGPYGGRSYRLTLSGAGGLGRERYKSVSRSSPPEVILSNEVAVTALMRLPKLLGLAGPSQFSDPG